MGQEVQTNQMIMRLAKRCSHALLNGSNAIRNLIWDNLDCDFSAKRDGAYYLSTNESGQALYLVVPDNAGAANNKNLNGETKYELFSVIREGNNQFPSADSWNTLDFTFLDSLTLVEALDYIIYICTYPKIPGWDEFANWANNLMGQYGGNLIAGIDYIKIGERIENGTLSGGVTIQADQIQPYPSGGIHSASNFFTWIKSNLLVVDDLNNPVMMESCKDDSHVLSYGILIHIVPKPNQDWNDIILILNLRK